MNSNITTTENLNRMFTKPFRAIYSVLERRKYNALVSLGEDNRFLINYRDRLIKFDSSSSPYELYEQFYGEQYGWLKIKGKTVVDIGGGTADTAIYFILNGAREVYAFEPEEDRYNSAVENLKKNKIQNVHYIKKGVASLDEIRKYYVGKVSKQDRILKCDCEGAEHSIFQNSSPDSIKSFSQIMLEFHDGYMDVKKILERQGFGVKYRFSNYWSADFNGMLMARRHTSGDE